MQRPPLIIVTGISGAGKSSMIGVLEDLGYFCVDNLPFQMLASFVATMRSCHPAQPLIAIGMDVRLLGLTSHPEDYLKAIRKKISCKIFFLEAKDEILLRRYSETRRVHPVSSSGDLLQGIGREREMMAPIRRVAQRIIDTSTFNVHELKRLVLRILGPREAKGRMSVSLLSFGYKYGIPLQTDLTLDVRFLPNPFFVEKLRTKTGRSRAIQRYVLQNPITQAFVKKTMALLTFLIHNYEREGKAYLTIAFGCTGGHHRSVVLVTEVNRLLKAKRIPTQIVHRDISR